MSVWFITGASRGFGLELVKAAVAGGHQVVATARNAGVIKDEFPDVLTVDLDVTDQQQAFDAVDQAKQAFGRIDVVVNNAGRGLLSAVEEADDASVRAVFEVNVFGTLHVQRAVLPVLRAQRSGHLINISSVGGLVGSPGWGIYNSTKFAVEGFTEAAAKELAPLGVRVTLVEPGYFRTDFLDASSLHTGHGVIEDYDATAGAMRRTAANVNHQQPGDPAKAAAAIVRITEVDQPPLRLLLGSDCVANVESKLDQLQKDINTWRTLSVSTDHD